ncbi:methyltransferase domain-containing protein [Rhodopseudomonas palustris]
MAERPDLFRHNADRNLTWWPEIGVGYYPVPPGDGVYNRAYFERYRELESSQIACRLNYERCALVARHYSGPVVDVGVGAGTFIKTRELLEAPTTYGFDVNPAAVEWLKARKLYMPVRELEGVRAVTFWDSLEHIPDFHAIVNRVTEWVFVALPIFTDASHVLASKHYRRDEHVWYFTADGLTAHFDMLGFEVREANANESAIGREGIMSFAFRRRGAHAEWSYSR